MITKLEFEDVLDAEARIRDQVLTTPLRSVQIGKRQYWLKCENRQTGGAFKLRGASNRLLQLTPEERAKGVVAFSSGNHARGVAIAAKRLGISATIVMPSDAPPVKVNATRAEDAEVIFYDRRSESREAIAADLAHRSGATLVPSFDDAAIVAGQGTVGLEVSRQLQSGGKVAGCIVVPCGGGGLAAGITLACPDAEIVIVEPDGWDDMRRSLEGGEIVGVESGAPPTLCDSLQTPLVSPITFDILRRRNAKALSVTDREVEQAVRFAWHEWSELVEPGGAVALAAVMAGRVAGEGETIIVLSGGNIDPALHDRIVA